MLAAPFRHPTHRKERDEWGTRQVGRVARIAIRPRFSAEYCGELGTGLGRVSLTGLPQHDSIASMAKARYHYNIMLRPEPEGGYTAIDLFRSDPRKAQSTY